MINLLGVFLTIVTFLAGSAAMVAPSADEKLAGAFVTVLAQIAAMICFLLGSSNAGGPKSP